MREAITDFELSTRGRLVYWNGDLCVCHGIWVSSTCIGAKSVAISRKLACFRKDSTDFELSVRGPFTDSCETRLSSYMWYRLMVSDITSDTSPHLWHLTEKSNRLTVLHGSYWSSYWGNQMFAVIKSPGLLFSTASKPQLSQPVWLSHHILRSGSCSTVSSRHVFKI